MLNYVLACTFVILIAVAGIFRHIDLTQKEEAIESLKAENAQLREQLEHCSLYRPR